MAGSMNVQGASAALSSRSRVVPRHRASAVVDLVAGFAVHQHCERPAAERMPVVGPHLDAVGPEPRDVLDAARGHGAPEEPPAPQDRMPAAQAEHLPREFEQRDARGRRGPNGPSRARCPGNRRCCCRAGCGRARRRRSASGRPARRRGWPGGCGRSARAAGARRDAWSPPPRPSCGSSCRPCRRGCPRRWPRCASARSSPGRAA